MKTETGVYICCLLCDTLPVADCVIGLYIVRAHSCYFADRVYTEGLVFVQFSVQAELGQVQLICTADRELLDCYCTGMASLVTVPVWHQ